MKQQMSNWPGVAHARDTMVQFVAGAITCQQAMESLQVGQSQLYALRTSCLAARAQGFGDDWAPGSSGGNHMSAWPDEVQAFLRKALEPDGDAKRYSYAFAASEVGRRFGFLVDRSQARHWALAHSLQLADHRMRRPPAHVRRWQRKSVGELWQLDATPDYFLGRSNPPLQLIDMVDDCVSCAQQAGIGDESESRVHQQPEGVQEPVSVPGRCRGGVPKRQPGLQGGPAVLAWVAASAWKSFRFCSIQLFRF